MLADALTKQMEPTKLIEAMRDNHWNLTQPVESIMRMREKQRGRAAGKEAKQAKKDTQIEKQLADFAP